MLPIVLTVILGNVILFLGGGLAGWAYAKKDPPRNPPPAQVILSPLNTELARSIDSKASRDEVGGLKGEMGAVEAQLKSLKEEVLALAGESTRLKQRVENPPEPARASEPAPIDLKRLESRIDSVAEATRNVAGLPAELRTLVRKLDGLDRQLTALRSDVSGLPKQIEKAVAPPAHEAAPKPDPKTTAATEARAKGTALFREGRFLEARDLFLKQTVEAPDDARNWYYAALANGFATNNWGDETIRLVTRGIDREKAGTPSRAEIDAALAEVNQPQGKEWLHGWRQRAGGR
jgi:regulator of replication initiation timing